MAFRGYFRLILDYMKTTPPIRALLALTFVSCSLVGGPYCPGAALANEPIILPARQAQAPKALPASTLAELQKLLAAPEVADARLGISIVALGTAEKPEQFPSQPYADASRPVLFEQDADKRFLPASNMKLFTAALALKRLGEQQTLRTTVWSDYKVENGELLGPLELCGGGDPSFDQDGLRSLAQAVAKRGIRKVRGLKVRQAAGGLRAENLGGRYPDGWTLDDALWYYGPEVGALTFHRNQLDVIVTGGAKAGDAVSVELEAGFPQLVLGRDIVSKITTGNSELAGQDGEDLLLVDRPIGGVAGGKITITGKVAPKQKIMIGIAVPNPSQWALRVFREELATAGVQVVATPAATQGLARPRQAAGWQSTPLAVHESPPVGQLLKRFLKSSDNLYGELLWRQAGLNNRRNATGARKSMQDFVTGIGIDPAGLRFSDGSGLSRYNLITPHATTQLLAAAEKLRGGESLWNALPIAGVDGTLRRRMIGTAAAGNVRAKTGTFSIVSCLSGYVTTRDGQRLAVSILTNFARNGSDARYLQNSIFAVLANADFSSK